MSAWKERRPFRDLVAASSGVTAHLPEAEIAEVFDPSYHTRHVDLIFERVGLS
jgi:adenylosuccinate lyase